MPSIMAMTAEETVPQGRVYSCHTVDERTPWAFDFHEHIDCCDLAYIHRGSVKHEVNGHELIVREGMTVLIRHGDRHRLWSRDVVMYNLNFRDETLREAAAYLGMSRELDEALRAPLPPVFETPLAQRSTMLVDYQTLLFAQRSDGADRRFRAFLVRWLLTHLEREHRTAAPGRPGWLIETERFIEENVELPVTVADLARVSGRSSEHIARTFRAHLGTTPSSAINAARLGRAALLLAHTTRPILDICYSLGFNSASYFYRLFMKRYGTTPRRYRADNSVIGSPLPR